MKATYFLLLATLLLASCGGPSSETPSDEITIESLKASLKEIDDSLYVLIEKALETDGFEIDRLVYHEGVNRGIEFYKNFPKDEYAPYALDKVIGMYWALNIEPKTVEWLDTLITKYPDYPGIMGALERQKSVYDSFDAYNPEKIKYYTNLMLERDDLSPEKRADFELRLQHIDKPFEEFVFLLNSDGSNAPVEVEEIN
ncbi:MAG: hypothetical protein P8O07_05015 [Crocinitomicaceae bacterium]|nr:hypothetical protein [Crocinitomicaceae bacterium]